MVLRLKETVSSRQPIRIQYIIATLDRAGAEGQLAALLTRLDRERFEPNLTVLTRGGPHEEELTAAGIPYEILGKRSKLDPALVFRVAARLRRFRPQILHTWMFTANAFGRAAAILSRVPIRVTSERAVDTWKTWPYHFTDRLLAPWTTCTVANANSVREFVNEKSRLPLQRIRVIPNGVDYKRFEPRRHERGEEVVFCSIGRLTLQKRMDLIIRAIGKLRDRGANCRLNIVGQGPLKEELQALIDELQLAGAVELCGVFEDVREILNASDVFVLSSDWEGMPNVVLEAMASGLPVVATAVDGSTELVATDQTGLLVPAGDIDALATSMQRLAESAEMREQFGKAGRQRTETEYSMERMVERYEELYEELAK